MSNYSDAATNLINEINYKGTNILELDSGDFYAVDSYGEEIRTATIEEMIELLEFDLAFESFV